MTGLSPMWERPTRRTYRAAGEGPILSSENQSHGWPPHPCSAALSHVGERVLSAVAFLGAFFEEFFGEQDQAQELDELREEIAGDRPPFGVGVHAEKNQAA